MNRRDFLHCAAVGAAAVAGSGAACLLRADSAATPTTRPGASTRPATRPAARLPNLVFILADDLGYGDVSCLNPKRGKIATPNIDRLAKAGVIFTQAHGSSALSSPSRYSILTGRYNWRSRLQGGVLGPYDSPLIDHDRLTVPAMLQEQGYHTACFGKWHLGWKWPRNGKDMDFNKPIEQGPTSRGFDEYFGTDVPNYPPYCFIHNDHTVGIPSEPLPKESLKPLMASVPGPAVPNWKLEEVLPTITDKACEFIQKQAEGGKPFFLYFPLTSPHTPLAPTSEWQGKSGLNVYADYVMETDAMVGKVLDAIDKSGVADNTIVIFTSDNGFAPGSGQKLLEKAGHFPSADFRGYKSDIWEGGHHIPFIVRWPGVTKAGTQCDQLVGQIDMIATMAAITGVTLPDAAGPDSISMLPLWKGGTEPTRETLIHHSGNGRFAIGDGRWKLELSGGSGGWSMSEDAALTQGLPPMQLYDLKADVGEKKNVQAEHPEVVARLLAVLKKQVADGRSTPGTPQKNDVKVDIWKSPATQAATTRPATTRAAG